MLIAYSVVESKQFGLSALSVTWLYTFDAHTRTHGSLLFPLPTLWLCCMKCVRDLQVLMKCPLLCSRYVYTCNVRQEKKMHVHCKSGSDSQSSKQTNAEMRGKFKLRMRKRCSCPAKVAGNAKKPKNSKVQKKKYCKSKCAIFSSLLFLQWHKPHYSQLIAHAQRRVAY